ncbi:hypothetical protein QYM46_15170 [Brevibacterium sp. K11IcPPYGO002]|uniref:hypothetical protein n=1 Tax=Brevibacterium sp. K11IcPPYGO002 TaxID=3058837 RepID=UPI003D81AAA9
MNNKMKITGLILAGYMLGRTKKLGLALTVASAVAGTTAAKNRDQLLGGLKDFADSSPELKSLQEKITGRLAESGKSAVKAVAAKGVDQLSVKLQDQTEKMKSTLDDAADSIDPNVDDSEGADDEEDAPETEDENVPENTEESEADEAEPTDDEQEADEETQVEEEAPKKPAAKRSSTAKRSAKGTRSSKSSTASRGSRTKSGSRRSTTAKKTSSSRSAAKPEEAEDE